MFGMGEIKDLISCLISLWVYLVLNICWYDE